jgi:polyisoprenoid-binding protein YceI
MLLLAAVLLPSQDPLREVRSANGRFVARVFAPSDVEVAEAGGSKPAKRVSVHGLKVEPAYDWRLADDGVALVAIASKAAPKLPLVQVVRDGHLILAADFEKLALDAEKGPDWLLQGVPTVRMRTVQRDGDLHPKLDLLARDGRVRTIDLDTGEVRVSRPQPAPGPLQVENPAAAGEAMFVGEWFAPDAVFAGEPVPVHVRGSLPTPTWRFEGFSVKGGGDRGVVLVPMGSVPPGDSLSLQVLKGFDETAQLHGLPIGLHSIDVQGRGEVETSKGASKPPSKGRTARSIRVLPAWTRAFAARSGGFAGTHESVALLEDGSVLRTDRTGATKVFLATEDAEAAVAKLLPSLPTSPASRKTPGAADMFEYEVVRSVDGRPLRLVRDDATLEPAAKALVDALFALEPPASEPVRYAIDLAKSTIEVRTSSSGLLSAFGHDHRLMVRRFSGTVERGVAPETWALALEVEAGSLAVVDDESQKDRPEIEKEMNANVLEVAKYPSIRFDVKAADVGSLEGDGKTVDVDGDLAIHGRTKRVRIPVKVALHGETLRATGKVKLKLADFAVERTSAAGGTVKVADEIEVRFDVIATR